MSKPLTEPQLRLLRVLGRGGGFIEGNQVHVARRLTLRGLITLEDNGEMRIHGRSDGERWYCTLTEDWRRVLAAATAQTGEELD